MKIKKNRIYSTFRINTDYKKENLNDILKGTKSVLISKNGYKKYINNYSQFTKKSTFKIPEITDYPLLRTESSFLVPAKNLINKNKSEDNIKKEKKKLKPNLFLFNIFNQERHSTFFENYNKRYIQFSKFKKESVNLRIIKKRNFEKRLERYNTFFIDFFDKWNGYDNLSQYSIMKQKNNINDINSVDDSYKKVNFSFNIKERYSGLKYDENEIFNSNYDKFILDKIKYTKNNKIENYDIKLESVFNDFNEKKIQLKLESIKIIFYPQTKKNINDNDNDNFYIYLPLSYVFFFYYKDKHFFQKILMSILFFDEDFKEIKIKDEELYNLIKTINFNENKEKEEEKKDENDFDYLADFKINKNNLNNFLKGNNKYNIFDKKDLYEKEARKTYNRYNNLFMNRIVTRKCSEKIESPKFENRKIKIIHSRNLASQFFNEEKKNNLDNNENNIDKKDKFYNEYFFIWETPKFSYKIKLEMPKIFFSYEDIHYNIVTFCDKNLFLYLYKNNFINWDFFALNYIFTIKDFRALILKFLSLSKDYSFIKNTKIKEKPYKYLKDISWIEKYKKFYTLIEDKNSKSQIIFLNNKKVYNQINENNESYIFFYSDLSLKNYICHFFSYHIIIEYQALNPNVKWEFFLNFRQMKYFNEISKYDKLISFLPKIIKTDFEYGKLSINFSVFDDNFNAKILESKDKSLNMTNIENNMLIEIDKPYIEIEKIFEDNKIIEKHEFNDIFLQNLNKVKMERWSKVIVGALKNNLMFEKEDLKPINYFKSKYFKINSNSQDFSKYKFKVNRSTKQKLTYMSKYNNKNYEVLLKTIKNIKAKEG